MGHPPGYHDPRPPRPGGVDGTFLSLDVLVRTFLSMRRSCLEGPAPTRPGNWNPNSAVKIGRVRNASKSSPINSSPFVPHRGGRGTFLSQTFLETLLSRTLLPWTFLSLGRSYPETSPAKPKSFFHAGGQPRDVLVPTPFLSGRFTPTTPEKTRGRSSTQGARKLIIPIGPEHAPPHRSTGPTVPKTSRRTLPMEAGDSEGG